MAGIHGRSGAVKLSGVTVAAVTSFSYDEKADSLETTAMGDTSKSYASGLVDGSGSLECRFVNTDYSANTGQGIGLTALRAGTSIVVSLIPATATTTGMFVGLSGSCVINSYTYNQSYDGVATCTIGYQGVLTKYTG